MSARVWRLVDGSLERAVLQGVLDRNPCGPVRADLPEMGRKRVEPLPVATVDALITASDPRYSLMVELAAFAGLRWGEIAALQRDDVAHARGVVIVAGSLQRDGTVKPPKSDAGLRVVRLPQRSLVALSAHPGRSDEPWLFPSPAGGPLAYPNWRRRFWLPAVRAIGAEGFTFHDLRHTHASWLIDRGIDVVKVSKRLGHSRASTTLDIYSHLVDRDESDVIEALESINDNVRRIAQ